MANWRKAMWSQLFCSEYFLFQEIKLELPDSGHSVHLSVERVPVVHSWYGDLEIESWVRPLAQPDEGLSGRRHLSLSLSRCFWGEGLKAVPWTHVQTEMSRLTSKVRLFAELSHFIGHLSVSQGPALITSNMDQVIFDNVGQFSNFIRLFWSVSASYLDLIQKKILIHQFYHLFLFLSSFRSLVSTLIPSVPERFLNVKTEFCFTTLNCSFWHFWFSSLQHLQFYRRM